MSSHAVQQGRHALAVRKDDFYETPAEATRALCAVESFEGRVWEPACGRGAISRVLQDHSYFVVSTDLVDRQFGQPGVDFLMETTAPSECKCIVTNPPFKLADEFIRHGLRLVPTVIVLLRWAYAEGVARSDIIDQHLTRVWLGRERLPFMHREGYAGPINSNSGAPFAWFVFQREPQNKGAFVVRRISWRAQ